AHARHHGDGVRRRIGADVRARARCRLGRRGRVGCARNRTPPARVDRRGRGAAAQGEDPMTIQLAGAFWVLPLVVALLAVSGGLILSRLLRGPTGADRVVAIDAMTLLGVASIVTVSLITGQSVFLDVAVVLALVSFLGTVGFALLFRKDREVDDTGMNPEEHK